MTRVRRGRRLACVQRLAPDFTTLEPKLIALYEAVLERIDIGPGTQLLDVGCGTGLFLRLAAQHGATVTGIDGQIEALPYADDLFDVITGFNSFQSATRPVRALEEARRVACYAAPVVIATWGRPEQCEAAGYLRAVGSLLPPPVDTDPFALSGEGAIEEFASRGGLTPVEREEVFCVWNFPDDETLLRALKSTAFAVEAARAAGEDAVAEAVLEAVAPYRTIDGAYRIENVFTYLVARA